MESMLANHTQIRIQITISFFRLIANSMWHLISLWHAYRCPLMASNLIDIALNLPSQWRWQLVIIGHLSKSGLLIIPIIRPNGVFNSMPCGLWINLSVEHRKAFHQVRPQLSQAATRLHCSFCTWFDKYHVYIFSVEKLLAITFCIASGFAEFHNSTGSTFLENVSFGRLCSVERVTMIGILGTHIVHQNTSRANIVSMEILYLEVVDLNWLCQLLMTDGVYGSILQF